MKKFILSLCLMSLFGGVVFGWGRIWDIPRPTPPRHPFRPVELNFLEDVKKNTAGVAENKNNISSNKTDISKNESGITENRDNISSNKIAVEDNKSAIESLKNSQTSGATSCVESFAVYAAGNEIGNYISYCGSSDYGDGNTFRFYAGGKYEVILLKNGRIGTFTSVIKYKTSNCEGDPYYDAVRATHYDDHYDAFKLHRKTGILTSCHESHCEYPLYYSPIGDNVVYKFSGGSFRSDGNCHENKPGPARYYHKLRPNDPAVTGIDEYPFPFPITYEGMEEVIIIEE